MDSPHSSMSLFNDNYIKADKHRKTMVVIMLFPGKLLRFFLQKSHKQILEETSQKKKRTKKNVKGQREMWGFFSELLVP